MYFLIRHIDYLLKTAAFLALGLKPNLDRAQFGSDRVNSINT